MNPNLDTLHPALDTLFYKSQPDCQKTKKSE